MEANAPIDREDSYDPRERAAEKARSRKADEKLLASGAMSARELGLRNGAFGRFVSKGRLIMDDVASPR